MNQKNKEDGGLENQIQVTDIKEEKTSIDALPTDPSHVQEVPTVSTLLQRKKYNYAGVGSAENAVPPSPATFHMESDAVSHSKEISQPSLGSFTKSQRIPQKIHGKQPPVFKKMLHVEQTTLEGLKKNLKAHRKSSSMKKLDCLSFLATLFPEVCYFDVIERPLPELIGVLGFGNAELAAMTRGTTFAASQAQNLLKLAQKGEIFMGPAQQTLRAQDLGVMAALGFKTSAYLGVFPVLRRKMLFGLLPLSTKKEVCGAWVCAAPRAVRDIPPRERKILLSLWTNLGI